MYLCFFICIFIFFICIFFAFLAFFICIQIITLRTSLWPGGRVHCFENGLCIRLRILSRRYAVCPILTMPNCPLIKESIKTRSVFCFSLPRLSFPSTCSCASHELVLQVSYFIQLVIVEAHVFDPLSSNFAVERANNSSNAVPHNYIDRPGLFFK